MLLHTEAVTTMTMCRRLVKGLYTGNVAEAFCYEKKNNSKKKLGEGHQPPPHLLEASKSRTSFTEKMM